MPGARILLLTSLLVATIGLSGCGANDESVADPSAGDSTSPSATESTAQSSGTSTLTASPTIPDWPACASVWKAGAKLPGTYAGCLEGESPVKANKYPCSFGQPIVMYADQFYAVPRNKINQVKSLKKDRDFQHTLAVCSG
jgi:hypothetical protein